MAISYYHYLTVSEAALLLEDGSFLLLEDYDGHLLLDAFSHGVEFMTPTLFDLTYRVAREVGFLQEGVATGGSTSTLADTHDLTQDADFWNGGTVWILRDSAGAGAAPEKEYAIVSDFASPTVTLRSNLTAAVASGDRYAIADDRVPLHTIISKINQALMDMGHVPYVDSTTLTIEGSKTEYTLPVQAGLDLREVWYQTYNSDADDNRWTLVDGWNVSVNTTGTGSTLILPTQLDAGYKLKLVYMAEHPHLYDYDDMLSDAIPMERIVYPAVRDCFIHLRQQTRRSDFDNDIATWTQKAEQVRNTRPIFEPKRRSRAKTIWVQGNTDYPGDRNNLR